MSAHSTILIKIIKIFKPMDNLNLEKMQQMLNPKNIGNTIRTFIGLGSKDVVEQFLEQADLTADGAEFLAVSAQALRLVRHSDG